METASCAAELALPCRAHSLATKAACWKSSAKWRNKSPRNARGRGQKGNDASYKDTASKLLGVDDRRRRAVLRSWSKTAPGAYKSVRCVAISHARQFSAGQTTAAMCQARSTPPTAPPNNNGAGVLERYPSPDRCKSRLAQAISGAQTMPRV